MKEGGVGGSTTITGLAFEKATDLRAALERHPNLKVVGDVVYCRGNERGQLLPKSKLYNQLLAKSGVDWKKLLSKQLFPDDALLVHDRKLLTVLEKKFQRVEGSVDEKLQTCDFKKRQYSKLLSPLRIKVQYCYVLNDWFENPKYRDVLAYIESVGCQYFFRSVPVEYLGL